MFIVLDYDLEKPDYLNTDPILDKKTDKPLILNFINNDIVQDESVSTNSKYDKIEADNNNLIVEQNEMAEAINHD